MELLVRRTDDFEVTGLGAAPQWNKVPWVDLNRLGEGRSTYATRVKALYSAKGLYFLVDCEDRVLTADMTRDFDELYMQDVVEVFLWPEPSQIVYFEYELSPLDHELPLIIANNSGKFCGWMPFCYDGDRRTRHATAVRGGHRRPHAKVDGWSCEFFIPYELLLGLRNVPPTPGSTWRGNVYRIDYDDKPASYWALCPETGSNFHNYEKFGTLRFE